MGLGKRETPFWVIKNKGKDPGLYRITKVSSKYGVDADMYVSSFAIYSLMSKVRKIDKHFGYSTFQHFIRLEKANITTKRNFLKVILKGVQ
jgi:hypothetical protein